MLFSILQQRKVTTQDTKDLMQHLLSLDSIIQSLVKKIGKRPSQLLESSESETDSITKNPNQNQISSDLSQQDIATKQYEQKVQALKQKMATLKESEYLNSSVKIDLLREGLYEIETARGLKTGYNIAKNGYFFDDLIGFKGIHHHRGTPSLWLGTDPTLVDNDMQRDILEAMPTIDPAQLKLVNGQRQTKERLLRLCELHRDAKQVFILVVGQKKLLDVYGTLERDEGFNTNDKHKIISAFKVKLPDKNLADATLLHLPADDNDMELTSHTLESLHHLYQVSIAEKQPLMVHCSDGINLTPKIAFAFELFHHWDNCFSSDNKVPDVGRLVTEVYQKIRASSSPHALSQLLDIHQAFLIALDFKTIAMERNLIEDIQKFLDNRKNDKEFDSRRIKIESHLKLIATTPVFSKAKVMEDFITANDDIRANHTKTFIKENYRSAPEHYTLLMDLKRLATIRSETELELTIFTNSLQLNNSKQLEDLKRQDSVEQEKEKEKEKEQGQATNGTHTEKLTDTKELDVEEKEVEEKKEKEVEVEEVEEKVKSTNGTLSDSDTSTKAPVPTDDSTEKEGKQSKIPTGELTEEEEELVREERERSPSM